MTRHDSPAPVPRPRLVAAIRAERAALARDLAGLTAEQWAHPSLCDRWTVEEVVAHLTAGARVGRWRWLASMLAARFDPAVHNDRRLAEHRGATPAETLRRFERVVDGPAGPTNHTAAWLGEVVVHAEDVRRPLGLVHVPPVEATTAVARFFAARDFAVASRSALTGVRVEVTDGPFAAGHGDLVRGPTLALVMAMAGRAVACDDLEGDGVALVRSRAAGGERLGS